MQQSQFTAVSRESLPQPDGDSRPIFEPRAMVDTIRPANDPYQSALDELARAIIRAASIRAQVAVPERIYLSAWETFRYFAEQSVALADSSLKAQARAEAIQDLAEEAEDGDILGPDAVLARRAIDLFLARLGSVGAKAARP